MGTAFSAYPGRKGRETPVFSAEVFCVAGAMIGAGFASGREIMQFFSQYGPFSWGLALAAAVFSGALMLRLMACAPHRGLMPAASFLLLAVTGGAMTAASGELAALTVPLPHARSLGGFLTLLLALFVSRKKLELFGRFGKALLPLLIASFLLCLRLPGCSPADDNPSLPHILLGFFQVLGYCGLNVLLCGGVLQEAAKRRRDRKRFVFCACGMLFLLLLLGNAALLPHRHSLRHAALPLVMLLRAYGKGGYYLSAAVLYLAIFTTLTAVLRGMSVLFPKWKAGWTILLCAAASLAGFEEIVSGAYPLLGGLAAALILSQKQPRGAA